MFDPASDLGQLIFWCEAVSQALDVDRLGDTLKLAVGQAARQGHGFQTVQFRRLLFEGHRLPITRTIRTRDTRSGSWQEERFTGARRRTAG